jgi:membrane protein
VLGFRNHQDPVDSTPVVPPRRTIVGLLKRVWSEYQRDYAGYFAAAMVYYALVSLIPLLLLVLSAVGLLPRFFDVGARLKQDVLRTIESSLGTPARVKIGELLDQLQRDSVIATAISLGALVVTASALFGKLRLSFRAIWKHRPPLVSGTVKVVVLSTFLEQAISFALTLVAGALLLVSLVLFAIVQWLGGHLQRLPWLTDVSRLEALTSSLVTVTLTFVMLFRFLPPVRVRWRYIWIVSLACAIASLVAAEVLALYGIFFAAHFSAWGAAGGLLMIMLWMYVVSQILFYGAELCKVMSEAE